MKSMNLLPAAITVVVIAGCQSTSKVRTETKADVNLGRYHTFALLPLPPPLVKSEPGARVRLAEAARRAVVEALTSKGYAEASGAAADFSVNLRGQSLPKVEVTDLGFHYPV